MPTGALFRLPSEAGKPGRYMHGVLLKQHYIVIDDKLIPDIISSLVLSQKLKKIHGSPVSGIIHYSYKQEWNLPERILGVNLSDCGIPESFIREMTEKMVRANGILKADLRIKIYPGVPGVLVIEDLR